MESEKLSIPNKEESMGLTFLQDNNRTRCEKCGNDTFYEFDLYIEDKHVPTDKQPPYYTKEVVGKTRVCGKCRFEMHIIR